MQSRLDIALHGGKVEEAQPVNACGYAAPSVWEGYIGSELLGDRPTEAEAYEMVETEINRRYGATHG